MLSKRSPVLLLGLILAAFLLSGAVRAEPPSGEIRLSLMPESSLRFTNVLNHYVTFDARVEGAEKVKLQLLNPEGTPVSFRTSRQVAENRKPVRSAGVLVKKGQEICEGLNILFPSDLPPGTWTIRVTAAAAQGNSVTEELTVEVTGPRELKMNRLREIHEILTGAEGAEPLPAEKGRIRFVCQDPKDSRFVKEYWFSKAFDLLPGANQKCTRAALSMALSWMGIDCTPVRMSELVRSEEIFYTYDPVCEKLGVTRTEGDLETLWAEYEAGRGSPVLLHFTYSGGGMHGVLLVARDPEDPELFYAVTSGTGADTSAFPDGKRQDAVIPLLIEKGETGERIQSPLLKRYHKGKIDQIWQWRLSGENDGKTEEEP